MFICHAKTNITSATLCETPSRTVTDTNTANITLANRNLITTQVFQAGALCAENNVRV